MEEEQKKSKGAVAQQPGNHVLQPSCKEVKQLTRTCVCKMCKMCKMCACERRAKVVKASVACHISRACSKTKKKPKRNRRRQEETEEDRKKRKT